MAKQTIKRKTGQSFMNSNGCVLVFRACSLMNLLKIKVGISEKNLISIGACIMIKWH